MKKNEMRKNYQILNALSEMRITQAELARQAKISSEARLSRIIHYLIKPTELEIQQIARILKINPKDLKKGGV